MRVHKNSELGKSIKKSRNSDKPIRSKRKIINYIYQSGTKSRWPLKTIPYIFDSKISIIINLIRFFAFVIITCNI